MSARLDFPMPFLNPFAVVLGMLFLIMIAKAIVIIPENRRGAVVRLGRYLKTLAPGLHISVPFIDLVTKLDLDANIPGWQGLSERELAKAIEASVTLGAAAPAKSGGKRSAAPSGPTPSAPEAKALAAWLVKTSSDQMGVDLSNDQMAKDRLAERARSAVEELRSAAACEINLPFLTADQTGPKHFSCSLTRSQLDEILGSNRG